MKNLNIEELNTIQYFIRKILLPIKGTGMSFEFNKILSRVDKKIKQLNAIHEKIKEGFYIKDDNGLPKRFVAYSEGENLVFKRDDSGNLIEVKNSTLLRGEMEAFKTEDSKEYDEAIKKFIEDKIEININDLDASKIQLLFESNILDGIDIAPLYGLVIATEEETKE
jgi:hypothetical protein